MGIGNNFFPDRLKPLMEQGTAVYSAENHELPAFRTDAAFCLHGALFLLLWIHNRRLSGPDTETEVAR